jgi:3D (Asp-Asp-Asp) domain-containing protein
VQLVRIQNGMFRTIVTVALFSLVFSPATLANWAVLGLKTEQMVNDTVTVRTASPSPLVEATQGSVSTVDKGEVRLFEVTAYSPTVAETDNSPHITATMKHVRVGGIAADIRVLPFGSLVIIPGYNDGKPCEVIDTGGAIKGNILDVFFWSSDEAKHWGRRKNVPITIIQLGNVD